MKAIILTAGLVATLVGTLPASAQAAKCTITGTARGEVLRGTSRADVICAGGGNDVVYGNGGNDTVYAGDGNDRVSGGSGSDYLIGGSGADHMDGGIGNDIMHGGYGPDKLSGSDGHDKIDGSHDNDTLIGGNGTDTIIGGTGIDQCVVYREGEFDEEGNSICDRWAYNLPGSFADYREEFRRLYPAEASERVLKPVSGSWRHCLVSNCESATKDYCVVRADGYVLNCIVSNGGNGGFDNTFTELKSGTNCGLPSDWGMCDVAGNFPVGSWVVDRSRVAASNNTWLVPRAN